MGGEEKWGCGMGRASIVRVRPRGATQRALLTPPRSPASPLQDAASSLQLALTIAVRWALARRQGEPLTGGGDAALSTAAVDGSLPHPTAEPQLLDYVTHQAKLMPLLAKAVAYLFTARRMMVRRGGGRKAQ